MALFISNKQQPVKEVLVVFCCFRIPGCFQFFVLYSSIFTPCSITLQNLTTVFYTDNTKEIVVLKVFHTNFHEQVYNYSKWERKNILKRFSLLCSWAKLIRAEAWQGWWLGERRHSHKCHLVNLGGGRVWEQFYIHFLLGWLVDSHNKSFVCLQNAQVKISHMLWYNIYYGIIPEEQMWA